MNAGADDGKGKMQMQPNQSRRRFLTNASLLTAGIVSPWAADAAEPPPETSTIRLRQSSAICFAPQYLVESFLQNEGFERVEWIYGSNFSPREMVANGDVAFDTAFAGNIVHYIDRGLSVTAVGGLHVGCYELFAHEPIDSISDLKGKRVGIGGTGARRYVSIMARHIGLDPNEDIVWVKNDQGSDALDTFLAGETDAFFGFPPEPQMIRARGFDRVILNTTMDLPWSQYFCCMVYGNRTWVRDHPVATKRFLRAVYKAADFCTTAPEAAARGIVDGGFVDQYEYALETIDSIPYELWREYDPADTMRFYALRLHEAGMLESHPNALLAEGTDWRFVDQLRVELKG